MNQFTLQKHKDFNFRFLKTFISICSSKSVWAWLCIQRQPDILLIESTVYDKKYQFCLLCCLIFFFPMFLPELHWKCMLLPLTWPVVVDVIPDELTPPPPLPEFQAVAQLCWSAARSEDILAHVLMQLFYKHCLGGICLQNWEPVCFWF